LRFSEHKILHEHISPTKKKTVGRNEFGPGHVWLSVLCDNAPKSRISDVGHRCQHHHWLREFFPEVTFCFIHLYAHNPSTISCVSPFDQVTVHQSSSLLNRVYFARHFNKFWIGEKIFGYSLDS